MATEPFLQAEPALTDLAKQLEHWRQTHPAALDRIPAHFWKQAVVLATLLPRSHIAERLHLSPTELQKRCLARQEALLAEAASPHPGFVEVTPAGTPPLEREAFPLPTRTLAERFLYEHALQPALLPASWWKSCKWGQCGERQAPFGRMAECCRVLVEQPGSAMALWRP